MSKENKDIEKAKNLIGSITGKSESQQDRFEVTGIKSLNIVDFLDALITKAEVKNNLKDLVIKKITQKIDSDDPEVTFIALLQLTKILEDSDNDFTLGLLNNMKEFYKINKEAEVGHAEIDANVNNSNDDIVTKENMLAVKELLKLMKKIDSSEFT